MVGIRPTRSYVVSGSSERRLPERRKSLRRCAEGPSYSHDVGRLVDITSIGEEIFRGPTVTEGLDPTTKCRCYREKHPTGTLLVAACKRKFSDRCPTVRRSGYDNDR